MRVSTTGLALLLLVLLPSLSQGQNLDIADLEKVKVAAYSKSFATRFALPVLPAAMQTEEPVHALEFTIERVAPSGYYECVLKAYLDSTLEIDFPIEGRSGALSLLGHREHFIFDNNEGNTRWLALDLQDRLYFNRQDKFGRRAALGRLDVDWPKKGYFAGLTYEAFFRDIFPQITYIKFSAPCGLYAWGKGKQAPQLLIERVGGKDYRRIIKPDPADFLKLEIPAAFYEATLDSAERAWQRTRDEIERSLKK